MLPMMNLNADSTNVGKQISSIKTYINQLRDSMDDELSHISYEQLDRNLQKKIDALNDSIRIAEENAVMVAEVVKAKYVTADVVAATYITASQVSASYATIGSLSAVSARLGTVEANYITAGTVAANYAAIGELNAVKATVNTINANYITANDITASFINSKFTGSTGLQASRIYCDSYHVNAEGQSYALSPTRITVGSRSLIVIGG